MAERKTNPTKWDLGIEGIETYSEFILRRESELMKAEFRKELAEDLSEEYKKILKDKVIQLAEKQEELTALNKRLTSWEFRATVVLPFAAFLFAMIDTVLRILEALDII